MTLGTIEIAATKENEIKMEACRNVITDSNNPKLSKVDIKSINSVPSIVHATK
jgi:hypothetical protein